MTDDANTRRCRREVCDKPIHAAVEKGARLQGHAAERAAAWDAGYCSTHCWREHAAERVRDGECWWQKEGQR